MSELMSMRMDLLHRLGGRLLLGLALRRLRRPRPRHRQADAVPEGLHLALDLVMSLDEVLEDRLVPLEPRGRDELHPLAARRLVRRLGAAVPDGDLGIARH